IPSIAPLLPGSILYRGLIEITQGTAVSGLLSLVEAVTVGLALGAGVNLGGELMRAFQRGGLAGAGMRSRPAARRTRGGYWPAVPGACRHKRGGVVLCRTPCGANTTLLRCDLHRLIR